MRVALLTLASSALVVLALCELGFAYPVAGWLYLWVALLFAAALLWRLSGHTRLFGWVAGVTFSPD
jgi:hypothetical protein